MAGEPIELEEARALVLDMARALAPEAVDLRAALGRTLAEDAVAAAPVQGFDNSAMDGFAVRAADTAGAGPAAPVALRIAGESRAGRPAPVALGGGEAIRISTGAMLPEGADAVVRIEETASENGRVTVATQVAAGHDLRRAGEDVAAGETVLRAGAVLGPTELGVLASLGREAVLCRRRPRVAVLTSGDELLGAGKDLWPGAVHDSNSHAILAAAARAGAELCDPVWVPDLLESTRAAIATALGADLAIVCGGISVGDHDHVRTAMGQLGVEPRFSGVALRPGRPTWFGVHEGTPVFGLPGNPVSALVAFALLVRPALAALAGRDPGAGRATAALAAPRERSAARSEAAPCTLAVGGDGLRADPGPQRGSHVLTGMLGADGLAILPPGGEPLAAGDVVEVELLEECRWV